MKKQFIILISILAFFAISCQEDYSIGNPLELTSGEVPVRISYSLENLLETGSEIVPMSPDVNTRAGEQIKANISYRLKVLLAKEVNGKWVLHDIFNHQVIPGQYLPIDITDSSVFRPILMTLTPGTYKVVLITGVNAVNWNAALVPGMVLEEGENALWACTYNTSGGEINPEWPYLQEEIFSGAMEFNVRKTDDVNSVAYNNDVSLTLTRKVAKLRLLMRKRTQEYPGVNADQSNYPGSVNWKDNGTDIDFILNAPNAITAKLEISEPGQKFCNGLDVWGQPQSTFFSKPEFASTLYYGVYAPAHYYMGNDGNNYLLGMKQSSRHHSQFFFVKPDQPLPVIISKVRVSAQDRSPVYVYDDNIEGISLQQNTISGLIFESGNQYWYIRSTSPSGGTQDDPFRELLVVKEDGVLAKPETKFNNYYELTK